MSHKESFLVYSYVKGEIRVKKIMEVLIHQNMLTFNLLGAHWEKIDSRSIINPSYAPPSKALTKSVEISRGEKHLKQIVQIIFPEKFIVSATSTRNDKIITAAHLPLNKRYPWKVGVVKIFFPERRFGFVTDSEGLDYFFHRDSATHWATEFDRAPQKGEILVFNWKDTTRGPQATAWRFKEDLEMEENDEENPEWHKIFYCMGS